MKTKIHSLIAIAALAALAPSISHAEDGTITFTGTIKAQTCKINEGSGGPNFTVTLPKVSTSALSSGGQTAGKTPFSINLTNCSPATGTVFTQFESPSTINTGSGHLINASGTAQNVEVPLLNANHQNLKLGKSGAAEQQVIPATLNNGAASMLYYAQYLASGGAATVGTVRTSVQYSIQYQ